MQVLIMTDMEGISGIDTIEMISDASSAGHQFARERLMLDTNAAISGVFAGGADKVYVIDGHGSGRNFIAGLLDPRAETVTVADMSAELMMQIDAYLEVGIHAMAGTLNGFLDHTQSSASWYNYYINGCRCGEIAQGAAFAGLYGVPFVMVSGDEAACAEAREFLGPVECTVVKSGIGRNRASLVDPDEALRRIEDAARKSFALIGIVKPFKLALPLEIKLELYRTDMCDALMARCTPECNPKIERLDARTVRKIVAEPRMYRDFVF